MKTLLLFVIALGLSAAGCSSECQTVCERHQECWDADLDVDECTDECQDESDDDEDHAAKAAECAECESDKVCSEIIKSCLDDCHGVRIEG